MTTRSTGGPPPVGKFALVNSIVNSIPGPLFTAVMNFLYIVGDAEKMTEEIERGDVPPEMMAMFDLSGPLPRLIDNDLLFTRVEAYEFNLVPRPAMSRVAPRAERAAGSRAPQPYRMTGDQLHLVSEQIGLSSGELATTGVYNITHRSSGGQPLNAYSPIASGGLAKRPVGGLVDVVVAETLPVPGFTNHTLTHGAHLSGLSLPNCMAYVGNGVLLGAASFGPLHVAAQSLWSKTKRKVPMSVKVYHAHPSGRFFTIVPGGNDLAMTAGIDDTGTPIGYSEFIMTTIMPRDVDINPDGAPCAAKVRKTWRAQWANLFGDPFVYWEPPVLGATPSRPRDRDHRVLLENVLTGHEWAYRYDVDGSYNGKAGNWRLLPRAEGRPPDATNTRGSN